MQRVDAALAEAVEESLQEQFHQNPRYALRMESSALSSSAEPVATMRPVSSRYTRLADVHRQVGVLLDQQHRQPVLRVEPFDARRTAPG